MFRGFAAAAPRLRDTPASADPAPCLSRPPDHVGCHPSRAMRPRICRKSVDVKWLSASWRMKYRACRMRRPPVLNSRCWRLVRDQLWMATGKTSRVGADDSATTLTVGKAVVVPRSFQVRSVGRHYGTTPL